MLSSVNKGRVSLCPLRVPFKGTPEEYLDLKKQPKNWNAIYEKYKITAILNKMMLGS